MKSSFFKKLLFGGLFILPFIGNAQNSFRSYLPDQNGYLRETQADFTHLLLDLSFEPEKGLVKGKVTHTFTTLRDKTDSLFLDGPEILFKEIIVDGENGKFKSNKEGVTIYFPTTLKMGTVHKVQITYEATPKKGLYFIGWNDPTGRSRKQIWTQGEAHDNRFWIPMHDDFYDKVITEEIITFPSKYKVLSNGPLVSQKKSGENIIWHYKMIQPHAVYLIMLGIGEYDINIQTSKSGVKLINYMYPDQKNRAELTYKNTAAFMDFFEQETGVKYPWGNYSQIPVQDFIYGAMENTSATIFGDFFNCDESLFPTNNYKSVNAHEMAHQWFGDIITCRAGRHMWVNESFATHYQKKAEQVTEGNDYFEHNRFKEMQGVLNAGKVDNFPIVHSQAGTSRIYQKGSLVLDMMRNVAGNENYKKAITYYLNKHKFQNTTTYDLLMAFHDACGIDLTNFFEQWIFKGGEPHYKVNFTINNPSLAQFKVQQIHKRDETVGLFKMPISFEIYYKDGSKEVIKKSIEGETEIVEINVNPNKSIDYILFDPSHSVISQVTFEKSPEMLMAQALKASSFYDRMEALIALKTISIDKKRETLIAVYNKESFYAIKSEVLSQLAKDNNTNSYDVFKQAFQDKDANLKIAAATSFEAYDNQALTALQMNLLNDNSNKVVEAALDKLCQKYPERRGSFVAKCDRYSYKDGNIRIVWLKNKILSEGKLNKDTVNKNQFIAELIDLTSQSYEFRTRKSALETCRDLSIIDNEFLTNLADAMISKNGRLKGPAIEVFKTINSLEYNKMIIKRFYATRTANWSKEKQEELKSYFN